MLAPFPRTPEIVKQNIAAYYAMITEVDAQMARMSELGRIVKEDSERLAEQARSMRAVARTSASPPVTTQTGSQTPAAACLTAQGPNQSL